MKNALMILPLFFLISLNVFSCTIVPKSFCETSEYYTENLLVTGKIVAIDEDGIDLQIIDILRGSEIKTTVRIWNGTDFDCNGIWSLSASKLGQLNDTIIILFAKNYGAGK